MKQLPKKVPIKGVTYAIKLVSEKNPTNLLGDDGRIHEGAIDNETCIIYIANYITLEKQWSILFHEIVHAIEYSSSCKNLSQESCVEIVGTETFTVIRAMGLL